MLEETTQGEVLVSRPSPHLVLLTLNRPEARNAVNAVVAQSLDRLVKATEADPDVWAVVLTGAGGKVFCAGADLKEVSRGNVKSLFVGESGFAGFVHSQRKKPWVAAVEGLALAGGCEIALACDIIVASEGGGFGLPEVMRGLAATAGGLYRLPRSLPRAVATDLILTAERISSERAAEFGLVSRLAPAGKALEVALAVGLTIVGNAPMAVRESLGVIRKAYDLDDATLRRMSDDVHARLEVSSDFIEGATAFVEKRPAVWTGT
jgi:enoyl-CoA hydratase